MIIQVSSLYKSFAVGRRANTVRGLRTKETPSNAVNGISFKVEKGEMVGFIGPNGAGKSTTIKMLVGILHRTSGNISVLGLDPQKHRKDIALKLGVVFGQRSQLIWELPLIDSFDLQQHMYRIPRDRYRRNLESLSELLDVGSILKVPVRKLSLGQRMRGEVLVALLHDPQLLLLDEPTIGLDLVSKDKLLTLLITINKEHRTTALFTSHDIGDVERVCGRLVGIDKGRIFFDGPTAALAGQFSRQRRLVVDYARTPPALPIGLSRHLEEVDGLTYRFLFETTEVMAGCLSGLLKTGDVRDIRTDDPNIEEVVKLIYQNPTFVSSRRP